MFFRGAIRPQVHGIDPEILLAEGVHPEHRSAFVTSGDHQEASAPVAAGPNDSRAICLPLAAQGIGGIGPEMGEQGCRLGAIDRQEDDACSGRVLRTTDDDEAFSGDLCHVIRQITGGQENTLGLAGGHECRGNRVLVDQHEGLLGGASRRRT